MLIRTVMIYAGVLGLLLVALSFNIMQNWVRVTGRGQQTDRAMRRSEKLLASFVEYVPFGLILLTLIELKGAPALVLHVLGCLLVSGRVLHAFGSNEIRGAGLMRFVGAQLTYLMLAIASIACIYYFSLGRV